MKRILAAHRARWKFLSVGVFLVFLPQLVAAQSATVRPRITAQINDSNRVVLRGNTHPLARAQYDQGAVADSQPMSRMLLLLQRGPDQETALRSLLDGQQSASSPNYHQWLTPQQFGQQFGPADADVQAVTTWLTSQGFQVARVSAGKTVIEFSGNAGQVRNAFSTQIHKYVVNGQEHFANSSDPQIPAALAPVVAGTVSLHNFPKKPQIHKAGAFRKTRATGQVTPLFTITNNPSEGCSTGTPCNALGPGDFDKIYNVPSTTFDGTGQTIAIVGDSDICTASSPDFSGACGSIDDVKQFRQLFGLSPTNLPTVIVDGPNPGLIGDETEGDLDTQWAGAVAKNATIDFVIAESTEATAGTDLAAEYVVDNNLAPVMSESFGDCEPDLGTAGNLFESDLWEQAAAQGITVIVSAGDNGSAGCDDPNNFPNVAVDGNFVNGIASTPFNVAAGGTDFDVTAANYQPTYWSGGNQTVSGLTKVSATQYIPETTWNDTCAQSLTGALTGCSPPSNLDFVSIVAGSGGQSNCSVLNFFGTLCLSFYVKPAWQSGPYVTGQASTDGSRDLPDISLFAADGFVSNSFYIICEADLSNGPCNVNLPFFDFVGVGGTSSAAPTFAGMMALVNQNMVLNHPALPSRQGNANYVLYSLASTQSTTPGLNCNSSSTPNPGCTFNDITRGNNSVPCAGQTFGCSTQNTDGTYGVLEEGNSTGGPNGTLAFNTGTGFDLATGLGSVNAANLITNWLTAVGGFTGTATTLCLSTSATTQTSCVAGPISITHGQTVWINAKVTPTPSSGNTPENVALIGKFSGGATAGADHFTSNNYAVSNVDFFPLSGGVASGLTTAGLVGGTYTVTAHYTGDGAFGASDSTPPISVTVAPESSTTSVSTGIYSFASGSASGSASAYYGDSTIIRADVKGAVSGQESGTGSVTLFDGVNNIGVFPLNTEGYAEDQADASVLGVQTPVLAVGPHSFSASYAGDSSYASSATTSAVAFNVLQAPTTTSVTATPVGAGTSFTFIALADTQSNNILSSGGSLGSAPSGTVSFCIAGTACTGANLLGAMPVTVGPTTDANGFVAAQATLTVAVSGPETVTATYNGDGNYTASTSSGISIKPGSFFTLSLMSPQTIDGVSPAIAVSAPGQSAAQVIAITGSTGYTGTVNLTCNVALLEPPLGSSPQATDTPTCSFNTSSIIGSGQSTLTVKTTAVSSVPGPASRPYAPGPNWLRIDELATAIGSLFLFGIAVRRRKGFVLMGLLILVAAVAATSCGGSGGGNSNPIGSNTGNNIGSTVAVYTVTVTATPTTGSGAQQTALTLIVN